MNTLEQIEKRRKKLEAPIRAGHTIKTIRERFKDREAIVLALRDEARLSLSDCARRAGLSRPTWYDLEDCEKTVTEDTLNKAAGLFGLVARDLLPEKE